MDRNNGNLLKEIDEERTDCEEVAYSALDILGNYYVSDYPGPTANYVRVYNKDFQSILDASSYHFITNKTNDELVVSTIINRPVYYGFSDPNSTYEIYNQNGEKVYTSSAFPSLIYLTEKYVIGVDEDNILKIFDYKENPLKEIMKWDDQKAIRCIVEDNSLNITIDDTDSLENAVLYSYDVTTLENTITKLDYKLSSK